MKTCLEHEYEVEMDKLRRNMKMNTEWWWRELYIYFLLKYRYDENGEVDEQAKWVDEFWMITKVRHYKDLMCSLFLRNSQ